MQKELLEQLRQEYSGRTLDEQSVLEDPLQQFERWFQEATDAGLPEVNAMTLATCGIDFKPSARIVLLKGLEHGSFIFYTNYNSRKGKELLWNPYAALLFFWNELHRQVRIEGRIEKLTPEESSAYFNSRPEGSKLGAIASPQSEVIENRRTLEEKLEHLQQELEGKPIPRPLHWGGYKVIPNSIEFWQGRTSRLHDRILFTRVDDTWKMEWLAP
ncbi:MAG TPA: pyridoxamine 5'-phosphate oxidase [Chitinophagales bacterium]|nr:pyridoxamine 5'-phosphate oxidase [Chitinophagales bacterium]